MDLLKMITQDPKLKAKYVDPTTNKLSTLFCRDYIKDCDEFMEHVVFIAHAEWAPPIRGPEFLTALKCNTACGI